MHRDDDHQLLAGGSIDAAPPGNPAERGLWVGIGGPVGVGKTALVAAICEQLRDHLRLGVVTNDIFTTEDADYLKNRGVLPPERIVAVETGACPHSAVRDDISVNLEAAEQLAQDTLLRDGKPLDLLLIESGGDNLTMTFSRGLVDAWVFVLDVAGGDDVPRKGVSAPPAPISSSSTRSTWGRTSVPTRYAWCGTPKPGEKDAPPS